MAWKCNARAIQSRAMPDMFSSLPCESSDPDFSESLVVFQAATAERSRQRARFGLLDSLTNSSRRAYMTVRIAP